MSLHGIFRAAELSEFAPFLAALMAHYCSRKPEILVGVDGTVERSKSCIHQTFLVISPNHGMNTYVGEVCSERMEIGGDYWEEFDRI